MPRIPISFKNTTKDMQLYTYVKGQEERSAFVKRALRFYLKYYMYERNILECIKKINKNKPT